MMETMRECILLQFTEGDYAESETAVKDLSTVLGGMLAVQVISV